MKKFNGLSNPPDLFDDPDNSVSNLLQNAMSSFPKTGQRPMLAGARIRINGRELRTKNFKETPWRQCQDILVNGRPVGTAEVCYLKRIPQENILPFIDPSLFINKEKKILADLAEQVARLIECRENDQTARWEARINSAIARLAGPLVAAQSIGEIASLIIEEAKSLTDSTFGAITSINPETGILPQPDPLGQIDPEVFRDLCKLAGTNNTFFLTNDPSGALAPAHSRPSGKYAPVERFLCSNVFIANVLAGQIALANPKRNYEPHDQALLERLTNLYAAALQNKYTETLQKQAKNELIAYQEELETIIARQAREIEISNSLLKNEQDERQLIEKQLQQSQKMEALGTLAGGIAHDFNNILTSIIGYAEMILLFGFKDEKSIKPRLDEILKAAYRARDLVHQILTFSRRHEKKKEPTRLQPIIKETLKLIRASLPSTIEIQANIQEEGSPVMADPTQIHQILMNLCTNAGQAMQENNGILSVHLTEMNITKDTTGLTQNISPGPYLKISVSDTGPGMEGEIIEHIFAPYFTTKANEKGTGLGLAIVKRIVKKHEGFIEVTSQPGQGTTFDIFLPRTDKEPEEQKTTNQAPLPHGQERILFVDDDKYLACYAKEFMESMGYAVTIKKDGVEALEAFRANPESFDLVITDQTMPKMTGTQLVKEIQKIRADIPIIMGTGNTSNLSRENALGLGAQELIAKPYEINNLWRTVRNVLDSSKKIIDRIIP